MIEKTVKVNNKSGLHARPASELVKLCGHFTSNIKILLEEKEINAKSIMAVMACEIQGGSNIKLRVEGQDEEHACHKISYMLENELCD